MTTLERILLLIAGAATIAVLAIAWVTTVEAQAAYATVMGR